MLDRRVDKYSSPSLRPSNDHEGFYFPDVVLDAFASEARRVMPSMFEAHLLIPSELDLVQSRVPLIPEPRLSYGKSRELIGTALGAFDKTLGLKANEIFEAGFNEATRDNFIEDMQNPSLRQGTSQWRLRDVAPGKSTIMRCLPAQAPLSKYDPANPNRHAVIQFEYDGTINSTIYLAHELGHAIADASIRDRNGVKYGDQPEHLEEPQAYFVQNIVAEHLKRHRDPALANTARLHDRMTIARASYDMAVGLTAIEGERAIRSGCEIDAPAMLRGWFGPAWQQYGSAKEVAGLIEAAKKGDGDSMEARETLSGWARRTHVRPISVLVTSALVTHLQKADSQKRHWAMESMLGSDGPRHINDVLEMAGVKTQSDLQGLAQMAIRPVADGLRSVASNPPARAAPAGQTQALSSRRADH